jgi:hypothetical protein
MVADAYPVSPECGSAICGGAPSLVHRLLSRCSRFVAGSHEGRLRRPDNLSESPSRVRGGRGEGLPSHH